MSGSVYKELFLCKNIKMFHANFLRVSIAQKWCNVSIPKSVVGEPVSIVVDLQNGIEIGFETGEILRFKFSCFEWKCEQTQTCTVVIMKEL